MLISCTTGKETFSTGSAQYHLFVVPTAQHRLTKETFIGAVAQANNPTVPITKDTLNKIPAAQASMVDQGTWWQGIYDVPDGVILKLAGLRTVNGVVYGSSGKSIHNAALLLQTRADAALIRITCHTTGNPRATQNNVTVEGRFDILEVKEALKLGAKLDLTRLKPFMDENAKTRLFSRQVLDREVSARRSDRVERVTSDNGEVTEVRVQQRRRALDLD